MHTINLSTIQDFTANYTGPLFDAMLCDPPYELDFMGKHWDRSGVAFDPATWRGVYDLLKPGAFLFAFGGTRTYHRMTCAIEDAGFEIRDCLMWVYGSGFPKSHDISKAIDKHGGQAVGWFGRWLREWRETHGITQKEVAALFPSKTGGLTGCVANWELGFNMPTPEQFNSICEKFGLPFENLEEAEREVVGHNDRQPGWFTNGDGHNITAPATPAAQTWHGYGTALKPAWEPVVIAMKPIDGTFANNALTHGVAGLNIDGARVDGEGGMKWETPRGGIWTTDSNATAKLIPNPQARWPANLIHDGSDEVLAGFPKEGRSTKPSASGVNKNGDSMFLGDLTQGFRSTCYTDTGPASRFFYTAKAHKSERNAGLDSSNHHPTVKPLELTKYLATLILPPQQGTPRRILVPFAGSGSEMIGAMLAGWDEVVGVEMTPEYVEIAQARMAWWQTVSGQLRTGDIARIMEYAYPQDYVEETKADDFSELPLFGARAGCD